MNWLALTTTKVLADLPTDLTPVYNDWLTANPGKAGRLAEIVSETVAEFRDAMATNPANILDADTTKLPESCIRSAENFIIYTLMMEMGVDLSTEAHQSMTRAEMFLRMISYKHFNVTADDADVAVQPSPAYGKIPDPTYERALP